MTTILLYSMQPILELGFQAMMRELPAFALSIAGSRGALFEQLRRERQTVLLLDEKTGVSMELLRELRATAPATHIVLWMDSFPIEFVSEAVSMGVRGVLHKNVPLDVLLHCLFKVAGGELWLQPDLTDKLLATKRVAITRRERQLVALLVEGATNKEIAYQLGITEGTVKVYLSRLFKKVGANNRFELAVFSFKHLQPHAGAPSTSVFAHPGSHHAEGPSWNATFAHMGQSGKTAGVYLAA